MIENIPPIQPLKGFDVNKQLDETTNAVAHYINQIKSQPDDFAHKHLENLQESIKHASEALVKYEFKKEHPPIKYDSTLEVLDKALTFLTQKGQMEEIKAKTDDSHEELATEIVVATNAIQSLVALLVNVRETTPIRGVDLEDKSYKEGLRVKKATGEQFKDGKT